MKRHSLLTIIPGLALLAVGCSTPTALRTTEYDDMYYSSADKTEFVQPEATVQANSNYQSSQAETGGGVINPEYVESDVVIDNYNGDEYYDGRSYDPRDNWYQPSYSFVDPYWGSAYAPVTARHYHMAMVYRDPFYNPYVFDPFYDPFYSPFYNPYTRGGVSVHIAFGSVWGNPYWGNPYARRFYGGGWYPYNNYYNGFYQGYHYGRNQYVYDNPNYVQTRKVQYGPRNERSSIIAGGNNRGVVGRPDRNTLRSENEQQAVRSDNQRTNRPSRTGEVRSTPDNTTTREAIRTRPGVNNEYYDGRNTQTRPQRNGTTPVVGGQERITPVEGTRPTRTRGQYVPPRTTEQPARQQQETRPANVRPVRSEPARTAPVRTAPVRTSPPVRQEVRPAPVRSEPVRSSGSSGSSESRGGGRPTRGGN